MGRTACTEPQCLYKGSLYPTDSNHERCSREAMPSTHSGKKKKTTRILWLLLASSIRYNGCWKVLSPTRKETSYSDQTLTFASHSKKNSESCPSNQVSAVAVTSASDEKWRPFNCFFSRVGLRTYQHPCTQSFISTEFIIWHISATNLLPSEAGMAQSV